MAYKIAADKKKHLFVGLMLGILLPLLSSFYLSTQPFWATAFSFIILSSICYGYELFSLITGLGHAENLDAIAGILGGCIGIGIYWCLRWLL